ncbi:T7SS effector LXG polymorphic toxin [Listeria booriae]|uniref:LXG domain-containing protein n=1 Tax=Listeria booriae TaxID=1552123 RepID=A0A7X0YMU6_9LIST|nr:T7SS effector LXG polymorphic toxin [Listeria booriae]MBC2117359.1 hypothetical protein [Listeria booriae]
MTRIDIAEVTHFRSQLRATNQEITPRIEAVKQAVTNYLNDRSITGEAIQASKEYYAGAYIQLCGSMKQALKMSEDKLQQYIQDFHSQVDPSHNARLDADGIYDLNQKINGFENRMESLTAEISAINGTQKASELNYLATQIFEAHKKEEILAKYLDFERSHANFFNELGELAYYIKQALQDIQKNIRFDRVTGTYGVDKLNRTNFKELSRLYASQQAIDDKIKEIEDIGLTPVIPNGNSAGFMMNDGQLNTTATLGFVNEQMIYWQNESTFRELLLVGSSYRVLYGIDAVTGQHVIESRLAFDLLVLASSAFGVSSFATRFGAVKIASFDKDVVLKNIEASKAARASSNFNVYASKEKAVLRDFEERIYEVRKDSAGTEIGKHPVGTLNREQTRIVVENLLDNGEISLKDLQNMIPEGTPNTFKPTDTMKIGGKFEFQLSDGQKATVRWHEPDPVAAAKFPNSTSGSRWTAQIKIGNKQVTVDGLWTKKQNLNEVHIPIQGR